MTPTPLVGVLGYWGGKKIQCLCGFQAANPTPITANPTPITANPTPITIFSCSPQLLFLAPDVLEGVDRMA